ncbi:Retrovirus-related Pol polyprotein from transposon 17.6, partial [Araneus ventricosus]
MTLPHPSVTPDGADVLHNTSMLQMIPSLTDRNTAEFFSKLIGSLGNRSKPQMLAIAKLKLEGRVRQFFEASLATVSDINYDKFKEAIEIHFREEKSFSFNFAKFSSAHQMEQESVKDFSVRIEGLAHRCLNNHLENGENISDSFRARLLLSQFVPGLKQSIEAQVVVANPSDFKTAVEIADSIQTSQSILTPNIKSVSDSTHINDFAKVLKSTTETFTKSLELVTQQLQALNTRVDEDQKSRQSPPPQRENKNRVTCFHCNKQGHYANECRKKLAERRQNDTRNSVTIPPLSQRYVDIKLENPTINALSSSKPLLIEKEKNSLSTSFLVSRSVSHLSKSSTCLALVLNLNDTPLTLNKGMVIANVSPIHEFASIENVNCVSSGNSNDNKNWLKEIKLNHLTSSQQQQVLELLNKYNSVFAQNISDLGECGIIKHTIQLTDDIPTRQKPYRVPYNLKNEMKNQINILLDAGIIQPSTSPYCAPVLLVKKSDGSFRLVADLRKLNSKTILDNFPLPKIDEMIDQLSGAKFFSTMDLTSGFHQMSRHPDHMHYTGIATEFGLFEYKRLPFGLKKCECQFSAAYEHCFGHTVREGQVLPDPKNLDSIKNTMPPRTKKQ